ncbi:MAG: hypothetical protein EXX96DRAFT_540002 [Benjaminiella poitrasii]|nr:MAG: hypothetical protein EXX96DRAFT_540002 [Benjaminiella poitrasii]
MNQTVDEQSKKISSVRTTAASISSNNVPYYGSREPKLSVAETDRVIFQMMDTMSTDKSIIIQEEDLLTDDATEQSQVNKAHGFLWRFRVILSSTLILLVVTATVIISESTKDRKL